MNDTKKTSKTSKTNLGAFLKNLVLNGKVSIEELAKEADISVSTVKQILRGDIKKPPMKRLKGFSKAANIDLIVLICLRDETDRKLLENVA